MSTVTIDFNRDHFAGQLHNEERKLLFETIYNMRPKVVCEVGTCRGGGSTYYIAKALECAGGNDGVLFTIENNPEFIAYRTHLYESTEEFIALKDRIVFIVGNSLSVYPDILKNLKSIDVCMLDGAEDSLQNLYEFCMFKPFIPVGGILFCHDWDTLKTDFLRPVIDQDKDWKIEVIEKGLAMIKRIDCKY